MTSQNSKCHQRIGKRDRRQVIAKFVYAIRQEKNGTLEKFGCLSLRTYKAKRITEMREEIGTLGAELSNGSKHLPKPIYFLNLFINGQTLIIW